MLGVCIYLGMGTHRNITIYYSVPHIQYSHGTDSARPRSFGSVLIGVREIPERAVAL